MGLKDLEKNIYRRESRAKLDSDRKNLTKYTIYNQNTPTDKLQYEPFDEKEAPFLSKYKKSLTLFFGGGIVVIGIIFLFNQGYQYYLSRFVENNILISFEGESSVVATEEIEYFIKYKNNNDISINNVQIEIDLPEKMNNAKVFIYDGNVEKLSESQTLTLNTMNAKQEILLKITGNILAEQNTIHTIKTNFVYNSERVMNRLSQVSEYKINIKENPIALDIFTPFDVASGEIVEYKVTLNNKKAQEFNNLELRLTYPDTFKVTEISIEPSQDNNVFRIPVLKGNAIYDFTVRGELIGNQSENKIIKGQVGTIIDNKFEVYAIDESITRIAQAFVSIQNVYPSSVDRNNPIEYAITVKNNSKVPIRESILQVTFRSDLFDFSTLDTGGGDFDFNSKTITWRANALPILGVFPPNASGTVNYSISLRKDLTEEQLQSVDYQVSAFSLFESYEIPTTLGVNKLIQGSDAIVAIERLKFNEAPIIVKNELIYDNSIQNINNSGPFPFRVNQPTSMTILWEIEKTTEDLKGVTLQTYLPENVIATGVYNDFGNGKFSYNTRTKEVFWDIGDVPAGINQDLKLAFQIQITPSINQKSRLDIEAQDRKYIINKDLPKGPIVLNETKYTATQLKDALVLDDVLPPIKTKSLIGN